MKACTQSAALLLVSLVLVAPATAQQFIDAPQFPTNGSALTVVSGDFNGDGNPDLAVGNSGGPPIQILLGQGNGNFRQGQQLGGATDSTYALTIGDWNGDGVLDLAADDAGTVSAVRVYLGVGDGTFVAGAVYPDSETLVNIATGDLNGDGVPDLVTAPYDVNSVTVRVNVLLGLGDGTFSETVSYQFPGYYSTAVAVADLNRDGRLDVIAAVILYPGADSALQVYLGNGDGSLQAPLTYSTPMEGNGIAVADLNGDGIPDLATVGQDMAVLFGKGDGTFAPGQTYRGLPGGTAIAAADMDGDGSPDLIELTSSFNGSGTDAVAIWDNKGDGTFRKASFYGTTSGVLGLAAGDINNDGHPDVVTASYNAGSLSVFLNGGGGTLIGHRDYAVYLNGGVGSLALGYIDADKYLDAAVVDGRGARVWFLHGNPDGSFRPEKTYTIQNYGTAVALGDVNGDGATDIVTANEIFNISVLLGNGTGKFKPHVEYYTGDEPDAIILADINNDGALDVITGNLSGKSVSALLNDGSGAFPRHIDTHIGDRVISIAVGDLNKDGFLDVATANNNNNGGDTFSILLGHGDGTFTVSQTTTTASVASVAIADVNNDGNLDVVVFGDGVIAFYPGNGDGTFGKGLATNTNLFKDPGVLADFNGDGKMDAAITGRFLLGNGDGTFQPAQIYSVPGAGIAAGDVNHDGALDLITSGGCCVSVLLNSGAN